MYPQLVFLASLAASLPLPQLTLEQFQERGRSLDDPAVLVSQPYATVRRQGRKGGSQNIKFPILEVRNPNELTVLSPIQNLIFTAGPVYKSNNELSTKDIEEKIKQINAEEVKEVKEEQLFESVEEEIDVLTDNAAADIVAEEIVEELVEEEIDELTDIAAAEIVAEEIAEELVEEEIDELTDIAAAEIVTEMIAEELVEKIAVANLDNLLPEDINLSELEIDSLTVSKEEEDKSKLNVIENSSDEGSGNFPTVDIGDIFEIIL